MKTFKQRVEQLKAKGHGEGKYLLQAIPNNEEGRAFIKMFRKHLNRDYFTHYTQGRKDEGSWSHSINQSESDHLVLYVAPKEEKYFRKVEQSVNSKLLDETTLKNHQINLLKQQANLILVELEKLK